MLIDKDIKDNYLKVLNEINGNTLVLFRMFGMKLTKRGEEWRLSSNYYITK
jgi:hypothetical protein